jgi:UDP-N-acetylmuramoyl-L-alanyl-D-glutamate--2,6-diaminopimelate ligase
MKLELLIRSIAPLAWHGPVNRDIAGVVCDSRQVRPGCLFVAVPGEARDGWEFVEDAIQRGAAAIVAERETAPRKDVCQIRVGDARLAAALLAAAFFNHPANSLQMAGITGTNGKTTTAYMIRDMLHAQGRAPGLLTTVAYEIGARTIPAARTTPDAPYLQSLLAQMLAKGCRSAVMEVSSHALVQQRIAGVDYDVGVFTNLTRDHLDYHQTMEQYFEAKSRFILGLGKLGKQAVAVINRDDPWGARLLSLPGVTARILTCGIEPGADVRAEDIRLGADGSSFRVRTPWGGAEIRLRLLGRYNVANATAALAAGGALGVGLERAAQALRELTGVPGRLQEFRSPRGFQVFVDYAHTDDALAKVLGALREITRGRLIVVFGCGGNRDTGKRAPMGRVAARLADWSILTSDNPRQEEPAAIIAQVREGFDGAAAFEIIEDRAQAIRRAVGLAAAGDTVLVAGKGHETYQELAATIVPFDDRQVVAREIEGRG